MRQSTRPYPRWSPANGSHRPRPGFTLIEVTLAMGVVALTLGLIALLPAGLKTVKNANEQAGAANVLNSMAEALRFAHSMDRTNFSGAFAGKIFNYQIGQAGPVENTWANLTLEGAEETASSPKRLSAVMRIHPPSDPLRPGRATLSVAWSAQANPVWNSANQTWTRAEGSLTTGIQFLAK